MRSIVLALGLGLSLGLGLFAPATRAEVTKDMLEPYRRPLSVPFPADAPYDPRIATLGKMLYFERAELEAWLRRNPVKTQAQIEAEAQQYVLGHSSKKK